MKHFFSAIFVLTTITGLSSSSNDPKQRVIELRNALSSIIKENEHEVEVRADHQACPFHACTAEILGCARLKLNDNGCSLCECAEEEIPVPVDTDNDKVEDKGRCMLKPDSGPCRAQKQHFYFDRAINSCQKFFYGGCQGNDNNFETLEECQSACENKKPASASNTPAEVPCPLHACTAEALNCQVGTGLKINENGCELCECQVGVIEAPIACQAHACTKEMLGCPGELARDANGCKLCVCAEIGVDKSDSAPIDKGACMLLPDSGPCRANHQRYYFDRAANRCLKFIYGGCQGNKNNFEELKDCEMTCGNSIELESRDNVRPPTGCPLHSCTAELMECPAGSGLAKNENGCELCECEEKPVPCLLHGCTKEILECPGELARNENGCELCECAELDSEFGVDIDTTDRGACMLLPDSGPCRANHQRYYFDRAANRCLKFIYGGCQGNKNNFEELKDCEMTCGNSIELESRDNVRPPTGCPLHSCTAELMECPAGSGLAKNENGCELCECEEKPVPCLLHGCTKEILECSGELARNENGCELCECAELDSEFGVDIDTTDRGACMLLPDSGPCRANHQRYYFDRAANRCLKFIYGGCQGNKNNFEELKDCEMTCGNSIELESRDNVRPPTGCPLHSCTAELMECPAGSGLAKNENGCELCECEEKPVPCLLHGCTKEILECPGELARNENGCELCECADVLISCPLHGCTKEMLGCPLELARNENGCELCECAELDSEFGVDIDTTDRGICMLIPDAGPCKGTHQRFYFDRAADRCMKFIYGGCQGNKNNFEKIEECEAACKSGSSRDNVRPPVACPLHSCTAETLGCVAGTALVQNENGCELCECVEKTIAQPCPFHACTKEMLGCSAELARNENDCELCQCEETVEPTEEGKLTECENQRKEALELVGKVQDGPFVPDCEDDGSFSTLQCYWRDCWCVLNPDGREVEGTRVPNTEAHTLACDKETEKKPQKEKDALIARREVEAALEKMVEEADIQ